MSGKSSNPKALSVEFFGLPAVGKSEISAQLGERLAGAGVSVAQPSYDLAHGISRPARMFRKLFLVLGESLRGPVSTWRALSEALSTGRQRTVWGSLKLVFNWVLVASLARRADGREGVSLFDEGLFQGLWSLGLEGDVERVEALVDRLPGLVSLPDLLVVSQASSMTVKDRVRARPDNDSRLDVRIDQTELLARGQEIFQRLCKRIEDRLAGEQLQLVFLTNETGADLDHNVGVLTELVGQRLRAEGSVRPGPSVSYPRPVDQA